MKTNSTLLFLFLLISSVLSGQHNAKQLRAFHGHDSNASRSSGTFLYNLSTGMEPYADLTAPVSVNNGEVWDDPIYFVPVEFPFEINGHVVSLLETYGLGSLFRSPTASPDFDVYIFPFEADLIDRGALTGVSVSPISYQVDGVPGSQILKIEFNNAGSYAEVNANGTTDMFINFQMWLHEGSNKIDFRFGSHFIPDPDLFYEGVGGAAIGTTDYDEANDIFDNAHFITGNPEKPILFAGLIGLNGTPPENSVYTLTLDLPLDVALTGQNNTSVCEPNGSAIAVVTGGQEPFTFVWNTGDDTEEIIGLSAGIYSVTVTDVTGASAMSSIEIIGPDELVANASSTNETASGAADGTATAIPTGGTQPYTFLWSNGETSPTIQDLAPGTYSVTVTDDAGCTATGEVIVEAADCPEILVEYSVINATCFGICDGYVQILEVVNATQPLQYLWSNGLSSAFAADLCAGEITCTITDALGCTVVFAADVTEPSEVVANTGHTDESVLGANDGTAWSAPFGGEEPYTYIWSNGSTDSLIVDLAPGNYRVTVTDSNGCTDWEAVDVLTGACGTVTAEIADVSCFGACDGAIIVFFPDGVEPIEYVWSNGGTGNQLADVCAGEVTVTATDADGCVVITAFTIGSPDPLLANAQSTGETVTGDDGTAWSAPSGGTAPYSYAWSNGSTDSLIVGLVPAFYGVTVTDANGCIDSQQVEVTEFVCFYLQPVGVLSVPCYGDCTGSLQASVVGGVGPFTYLWNTGDTTEVVENLCAGTYSVLVTDEGQGCNSFVAQDITQPDSLYVTIDAITHITDSTTASIEISVTGGTPPYLFGWLGPELFLSFDEDIFNIGAGTYSLAMVDGNNCFVDIDSIEILDMTVGIPIADREDITVSPNPATDILQIGYTGNSPMQVSLYSITGQRVGYWQDQRRLNVAAMQPGYYILEMILDNTAVIRPVIIE